jgi:hypothetical protein
MTRLTPDQFDVVFARIVDDMAEILDIEDEREFELRSSMFSVHLSRFLGHYDFTRPQLQRLLTVLPEDYHSHLTHLTRRRG